MFFFKKIAVIPAKAGTIHIQSALPTKNLARVEITLNTYEAELSIKPDETQQSCNPREISPHYAD